MYRPVDHVRVDGQERHVALAEHAARSSGSTFRGDRHVPPRGARPASRSGARTSSARRPCRRARRRRSRRSPRSRPARAARRASASGRASPSSSRSRAWKTKASASVKAVLGTPGEQRVVDRRRARRPARRCGPARGRRCCSPCSPCRPAPTRVRRCALSSRRAAPQGVARAARRIDHDVRRRGSGACSGEKPRSRRRRGMSAAKAAGRRVALLASSRRAPPRRSGRAARKPSYQMSKGSSGRPSRFWISRGDLRHRAGSRAPPRSSAAHAAPRDLAVHVEAARSMQRRASRASTGRRGARPRKTSSSARVAGVRLARAPTASARPAAPVVLDGEAPVTLVRDGVQSTRGLSITAAGIAWRTMRSITRAISRCLLEARRARRSAAFSSSRRFQWLMQPHSAREEALAPSAVEHVVHVRCCSRRCSGRPRLAASAIAACDLGGHARREAARQARLGPLPARPGHAARKRSSSVVSGKFSSATKASLWRRDRR